MAGKINKPATIFDHISGITSKKKAWDKLSEADQKSFAPYIIKTIDMLQRYTIGPLSKKHVYQLYYDILPNANVRAKYIKGKKMDKYNKDLVNFVKDNYQINSREAEEYVDLFKKTDGGINHLTKLLKMHGKTDKEIKKLLK